MIAPVVLMADYVLINNNNSRTKFALANTSGLLDQRDVVATKDLTAALAQARDAHDVRVLDAALVELRLHLRHFHVIDFRHAQP
ncbi:MAG: hypothetical protein AAF191_13615, partial [Verrucomicrobiota bacterium]